MLPDSAVGSGLPVVLAGDLVGVQYIQDCPADGRVIAGVDVFAVKNRDGTQGNASLSSDSPISYCFIAYHSIEWRCTQSPIGLHCVALYCTFREIQVY